MAQDSQFQHAGKKPGLQVWRVEKMALAPVASAFHGHFFTGDAYIVLNTISTSPPSYKLHTWMGKDASQDEKGAAAILMVHLDDYLNGVPVQYTEHPDNESLTFLKYFKSGLTYKAGGVATGFNHVKDVFRQRLLHVKGQKRIRANEVPLKWDSFNKGDCFIIDLGKEIYHWSGSESNFFERLKTTELALSIRDNERSGSSKVIMIDEGSEPEPVLEVLGPKPDVLPAGTCDKSTDIKNKNIASLHRISDATGAMTTTLVADKNPFKQSMLSQEDCYILDNGVNKHIYVWKGKKANTEERKAAFAVAQKYIKTNKYPPNTTIQIIPAGAETTMFEQFFFNWLSRDETTGKRCIVGRIAQVEQIPFDPSTLHENSLMAAQYNMVDDGSGEVQIWRVEGGDKVLVDKSTYGQFYGGDCYLVLYTYNTGAREKHIIYTWQGQNCSKEELGASAFLTVKLDDSMDGVATQVRVTQGQEPPHLVSMFENKTMVIYLGGTGRNRGEAVSGDIRLFHIRQSLTGATRAVEVLPKAPSLNTNDVFVLKSPKSMYVWKGKGGTPEELDAAKYVTKLLDPKMTPTEVSEGKESADFWSKLGGRSEYQTSKSLQRTIKPPRLFVCSTKTGRLTAEEVPTELMQTELIADDVMILDTWDQIFIWIGKDASETERKGSHNIATGYLDVDPSGRSGIAINVIKQGEEPPSFTGWFHAWDPNLWAKDRNQLMQELLSQKSQ